MALPVRPKCRDCKIPMTDAFNLLSRRRYWECLRCGGTVEQGGTVPFPRSA